MKRTRIQNSVRGFISAIAILAAVLSFNSAAHTQIPEFIWAKRAGGTDNDYGSGIATDGSGNSIIAGSFSGTATFGTITLTSAGYENIFIAKYDASGNVLWAKRAGGTTRNHGYGIATDGSGNAIVTGYFHEKATFDTITLTSAGYEDIFIAKYDTSGNVLWAKRAGGTDEDIGHGITTDGSGNSIITGSFSGTATFGTITLIGTGEYDIFIAKYDASGDVLWAKRAGGTFNDFGFGIATDGSGNSLVTGYFSGTATFGTITLTSAGYYEDIFIAKYDTSGNVLWAKRAGGTTGDNGSGIITDGSGNSIVTGSFSSTATFGTVTLTSAGQYDIFIAKYDTSGNVLWANQAGGISNDQGFAIATDGSGNGIVTGSFSRTATFGTVTLTSTGYEDIFIAKYDASGNVLWAKGAGGTEYDNGKDIATDESGNSIVTGRFYWEATFGTTTLISAGYEDIFIAKLAVWDITGRIDYYSNDEPVDSALIKANSVYSDTTALNGNYEILDLRPDNYVIRPEKEKNTGSAISTYDAAWILQYGVELRTFTPYQMLAGDVSGDGTVSAFDAAKILQYGVGLINQFSVMEDSTHFWRFVPEDFAITPSNWTTAPDSIAYTPLNSDTADNYVWIIYGDVTGNWHPSGATLALLGKSSGERVNIRLGDISGEAGDKVVLPMVLENGSDILAMSFTLEYDARVLKALSASTTEITENWQIAYNIKEGQIKVVLAGIKPIATSGAMVNLEFEVLRTEVGETSSSLNISEITINEGNIAVNIQSAKFTSGPLVPKEYTLSQNYPNPFNAQTMIKYQLPKADRVVLKIYNTLGQEVRTLVDEEKKAGYHSITWDGKNYERIFVSSGIYICRIQSGDFMKVRKMLFLM